eukprot:768715-Hanusia_phi.AAC.8
MLRSEELSCYQDIECFALSCPPVLSRSAAEKCEPFITTVVAEEPPALTDEGAGAPDPLQETEMAGEVRIVCARSAADGRSGLVVPGAMAVGVWHQAVPPQVLLPRSVFAVSAFEQILRCLMSALEERARMRSRASTRSLRVGRYSPH